MMGASQGIEIQLFGPLQITVDGVPRPRPKTVPAELVLASLACAEGRPLSRAMLVERVWPDADPARARHSLSQALTTLRNLLPDGCIQTHPGGLVALSADRCRTDVAEFRRLARSNDMAAIALFRDDFLAHLDHPWVAAEQSSLARILTELYDAHEHRLSEAEAERVRRLLDISVASSLPIIRNLPAVAGRFFGRETELAEIGERFASGTRLITLIAPGGFGKSRLAIEGARRLRFDGFLALADAPSDVDVQELVQGWHPGERLVLDNCEHLDARAVSRIQTLLDALPSRQILATSRHPLGLVGEGEMVLGPLPRRDRTRAPEHLAEWEALGLLLDRSGIAIDELRDGDLRQPLVEICQKLDGIPLAIELVAQRLRRRPVAEVLAALDQQLSTVETVQANRPVRHRSLEAALSGSLDALSTSSRAALDRLSIIPGSFELSPAEAILGNEAEERLDILHRTGLLQKSRDGQMIRHRIIDAVRERVLDSLAHDDQQDAQTRLWEWAFAAMKNDRPRFIGPDAGEALALWDKRRDILRTALQWTPPEAFVEFVWNTGRYWVVRGLAAEGRSWFERGIDLPADRAIKAEFWESLAVLRTNAGDHAGAVEAMQTAIATKRELGDEEALVRAQINFASILRNMGRSEEVRQVLAETLASPVVQSNAYVRSVALSTYSNALSDLDRIDEAEAALAQLIILKSSLKDERGILITRGNHAHVLMRQQRSEEALAEVVEVLDALIAQQDWVPAADFAVTLAQTLAAMKRSELAAQAAGFAEALCRTAGTSLSTPTQTELDALNAYHAGDAKWQSQQQIGGSMQADEFADWIARIAI